jgi:hypothetical protein
MISCTEIQKAIEAVTVPAETDHHATDFYCKVTPETTKIINDYEYKNHVTTFRDDATNELWYEIPFIYRAEKDRTHYCINCISYQGYECSCKNDGINPYDFCDEERFEPIPEA